MAQRGVDVRGVGGTEAVADILVLGVPISMNLLVVDGGGSTDRGFVG